MHQAMCCKLRVVQAPIQQRAKTIRALVWAACTQSLGLFSRWRQAQKAPGPLGEAACHPQNGSPGWVPTAHSRRHISPACPPDAQNFQRLPASFAPPLPKFHAQPPHHFKQPATMAPRAKKEEKRELMVSIDQFRNTRDQVCCYLLLFFPFGVLRCDAPATCYRAGATRELARAARIASPSAINVFLLCLCITLVASATRFQHGAVENPAACFASTARLRCD
jgi:hypothetical protein